jgi:ABC-type glutathione transport system ATPase component
LKSSFRFLARRPFDQSAHWLQFHRAAPLPLSSKHSEPKIKVTAQTSGCLLNWREVEKRWQQPTTQASHRIDGGYGMTPLIELRNITKNSASLASVTAVDSIRFRLGLARQCLVGESGCGKSTTGRMRRIVATEQW